MSDDLEGCSLADVLEKLEKGLIGHRAAMEWLGVESYGRLVDIMHFNERLMPGQQPMRVSAETRARQIFRTERGAATECGSATSRGGRRDHG
jgi:hypothetical protein